MLFILCIFLIKLSLCESNQPTIITRFDTNDISAENRASYSSIFPTIDPSIIEDVNLTTPQLITKYGYKAETHYVTTDDGYILELHRITGKKGTMDDRREKAVCLLQHGLLCNSASWILAGPDHSLGYRLSNENCDVWLGNTRGTFYGMNHTTINPFGSSNERKAFWTFSFHEMGMFDLPAIIDYILMETKVPKLHFVGHSQGTSAFFVMTSERPEYNQKIEMMHALAPIAFVKHIVSPPLRLLAPFVFSAKEVASFLGINYIIPTDRFLTKSEEELCCDKAITQTICKNLVFLITGYTSDQLNTTLLPLILGYPAGASVNQLIHFGQETRSGHFRQFDYGYIENVIRYKQLSPPDYRVENIKTPVALYYAQDDWLADIKDIGELSNLLPNVIHNYLVPHAKFNHIDFLYAVDVQKLVNDEIVKMMKLSDHYESNSVDC